MAKLLRRILFWICSEQTLERFVIRFCRWLDLDLIALGYRSNGILNYKNFEESGEAFLIGKLLPVFFEGQAPIIIDVGANVGEMTLLLRRCLPDSEILSFEPNPASFQTLVENTAQANIRHFNFGLGRTQEEKVLYSYRNNQRSGHASLYKNVFEFYQAYGVQEAEDLLEIKIKLRSLDEFCETSNIERIDFLKIDVEGNEFNVLEGARSLLSRGAISLIQFEFNDCNVLSRVFLRDFYRILTNFQFYRLKEDELLPLGQHMARHEIFQFQNILAVNRQWLDTFDFDDFRVGSLRV